MDKNKLVHVEVAYATPAEQRVVAVKVEAGSTIESAILCSGILVIFPEIDLIKQRVGVFSKMRTLLDVIAEGDRIEIYRPLVIDPKVARRLKASRSRRAGPIGK